VPYKLCEGAKCAFPQGGDFVIGTFCPPHPPYRGSSTLAGESDGSIFDHGKRNINVFYTEIATAGPEGLILTMGLTANM